VIALTVFESGSVVTTSDTSHKYRPPHRLADRTVAECGLLQHRAVGTHRFSDARGFSVLELLMVVAIVGILAAVAVGITPDVVRAAKGESVALQLDGFLRRTREMAISRRRNIQIRFVDPSSVESVELPVPGVGGAPIVLETVPLEGDMEYRKFDEIAVDTPDAFGSATAVTVAGVPYADFIAAPANNIAMFTSEGVFADANGFPVNATVLLGREHQPLTASAVTILGATAALRTFRWDGRNWVR
jgi:prepilin-type N-terminal cleavage/methylation domain-containing protein